MTTTGLDRPLSFDLDDPPAFPPPQCVDPVIRHLSLATFYEHQHDSDTCRTCDPDTQCERRSAQQGMLTACGENQPLSAIWHCLAEIPVGEYQADATAATTDPRRDSERQPETTP